MPVKITRRGFLTGAGACLIGSLFRSKYAFSHHAFLHRRIFITTDLGGQDNDDYQSTIHALMYTDDYDLEGLCPGYNGGRISAAMEVLNAFSADYHKLAMHGYPTPNSLLAIMKPGSQIPFRKGDSSPAAELLIKQAMNADPRLLHVCTWGAPTELAQALYLEPRIKQRIFCFVSGSWNRSQDEGAFDFISKQKDLHWIASMTTQRGMYVTGIDGKTKYGNVGFVNKVIRRSGHLGKLFLRKSQNINVNPGGLKWGDTASFLWALTHKRDTVLHELSYPVAREHTAESWGGRFRYVGDYHWTDFASHAAGGYAGAMTVAKHRKKILKDFEGKLALLSV